MEANSPMAHVTLSSEWKIALAELIRQSEQLRARSRELGIARVAVDACYRKQVARSRTLCAPKSLEGENSNPLPAESIPLVPRAGRLMVNELIEELVRKHMRDSANTVSVAASDMPPA